MSSPNGKPSSALLDREDNLVNFELNLAAGVTAGGAARPCDHGPEFLTFDLVKLKASFEMPQAFQRRSPPFLLLHGYGENRKVWEELRRATPGPRLGRHVARSARTRRQQDQESAAASGKPGMASESARISPGYRSGPGLAEETAPARIHNKIVIVGYDIGANLALVSSGKFRKCEPLSPSSPA